MLDADLAEIYGYRTKKFNEQVKNNIEKFDEDFRFRLNSEEFEILKSKISTSNCENSPNFDNFYRKGNLRSKIWTSSDESKVEPQGILRRKNCTSSEGDELEPQKILRSKLRPSCSWKISPDITHCLRGCCERGNRGFFKEPTTKVVVKYSLTTTLYYAVFQTRALQKPCNTRLQGFCFRRY